MTERYEGEEELLKKCAKSAGVKIAYWSHSLHAWVLDHPGFEIWNPLRDDGDSRRLVASKEMEIGYCDGTAYAKTKDQDHYQSVVDFDDGPWALRRAVVLAVAAEVVG